MEPRTDVPKTLPACSEAPTRLPKSQPKSRFLIEPLEERIAPDKKSYGGSSDLAGTSGY